MALHFEHYRGVRVVYDDKELPNYRQQLLSLLSARTHKATWGGPGYAPLIQIHPKKED